VGTKKTRAKKVLKHGLLRMDGTWLIEPVFEGVGQLGSGRVPVKQGGLWGFADAAGEVVIEPSYRFAWNFVSGGAQVQRPDATWVHIDVDGAELPGWRGHTRCGRIRTSRGGWFADTFWGPQGGLFGFLDAAGAVVVEPAYAMASDFVQDLAWIQLSDRGFGQGEYAFIDLDGDRVIGPFDATSVRSFTPEGLARFQGLDQCWRFMNRSGEVVVETPYRDVGVYAEGRLLFAANEEVSPQTHLKGYLDERGEVVIEPRFEMASPFRGGLAALYLRSGIAPKWGFIDRDGELVIENRFRHAAPFAGEVTTAAVPHPEFHSSDLWGLIDRAGDWVVEPQFSFMKPMVDGVSRFQRRDGSWGFIDSAGDILADGYKQILDWQDTFPFPVQQARPKRGGGFTGGRWGFVDAAGREVVPCVLDQVGSFFHEEHAAAAGVKVTS